MRLSELQDQVPAVVATVEDAAPADPVARRLRELGFVQGEVVRIVARGPIKADPVLVQVGFTRFALRRAEADRVMVDPRAA
jgi:ferrous iron transport protein A